MRLSEFISLYNLKSEKKPMGLWIHSGNIGPSDVSIPESFIYMQEWSDAPLKKIWVSQPYRTIIVYDRGNVLVYEHTRNADFRIQILDIREKHTAEDSD